MGNKEGINIPLAQTDNVLMREAKKSGKYIALYNE